ncbi:hypothetical protein DFN09_003208 [Clostridium acetobutylicum]|nr:hypothetical protein [Clostridium acetobutylicum]
MFDKETDKALADLITLNDEVIDETKPLEIFDPIYTWKKKKLTHYYVKDLRVQLFKKGELVYENPEVLEIRNIAKKETEKLWAEVLRLENPHTYYVDLSKKALGSKAQFT